MGNKVYKDSRKNSNMFNIEVGAYSYGVGVRTNKIKSISKLGKPDTEVPEFGDDEILIMNDGRVLACYLQEKHQ